MLILQQVLLTVLTVGAIIAAGSPPAAASGREAASPSAPASATALRVDANPWGNAISYNPYSPTPLPDNNYIQLALAYILTRPGPGQYGGFYRELASSWKLGKTSITFHLRSAARWQTGAPFTSRDVLTSMLLAGADENEAWADISQVVTPSPKVVTVRLKRNVVPTNVLNAIVQIPMVPTSQYSHLIPAGFQKDLLSYWKVYNVSHPTSASVASATSSSAGKAMAAVAAALVKFSPKTMIGDGPYKLVKWNSSQVLLKKWDGWWDAKAISAPWIDVFAVTTTEDYGALLAGRIDFDTLSEYSDPEVQNLDSRSGRRYITIHAPVQQAGLFFHLTSYPFSLLPVREALAYVIDRTKLTKLENGGTLIQDPATTHPDGLADLIGLRYLTKQEVGSLNPYNYDPNKAASLLKSVGFTKKSGHWYTPKGSPFNFTVYEPAGKATWNDDGLAVTSMLTSFGIGAKLQAVELPGFWTQQEAGAYPISLGWVDDGDPYNPLTYYEYTFVTYNYPATYSGVGTCAACHPAIGIGPISNVPGLGKVDLSGAITAEVSSAPERTWKRYVWDWARFVNETLPILPIYNNSYHEAYSTARYTDWPPESKAGMWTSDAPQLIIFMQHGYLKFRQ